MAVLIYLLFTSFVSQAQEAYLGINAGVSDSSGPLTPKQLAASGGVRAGWLFYDHFALGGVAHYYVSNEPTEKIAYAPLLAEILYFPYRSPHDPNTFYVGGGFGTTHLVMSDFSGKNTDNATTFSVTVGYSISLWDGVNLGPEVQYLLIYSDRDDFNLTNVHFSFKYFF